MSDGIIPTPEHAMKILSMPLTDLDARKEIRVPCGTPEKGLEAIDFATVYKKIKTLEGSLSLAQSAITTLQARRLEEWMPVGHIYVQLPSQPEPSVLYPRATWANISSSYTGSFFRVEGGNAASFGVHQDESVPNIAGQWWSISNSGSLDIRGAVTRETASLYGQLGSTHSNVYVPRYVLDASKVHGAYGRRSEVAPRNYAIRIWRKTGTISGTRSYALIDDDGIYQQTVELAEDEAGIIGHNPHIHIDTPPTKSLIARHAKASHEVLRYHRERAVWESVVDHRGRTAYHIDGSGSRIIHQLGDTLAEGETWDAPEPIAMT